MNSFSGKINFEMLCYALTYSLCPISHCNMLYQCKRLHLTTEANPLLQMNTSFLWESFTFGQSMIFSLNLRFTHTVPLYFPLANLYPILIERFHLLHHCFLQSLFFWFRRDCCEISFISTKVVHLMVM